MKTSPDMVKVWLFVAGFFGSIITTIITYFLRQLILDFRASIKVNGEAIQKNAQNITKQQTVSLERYNEIKLELVSIKKDSEHGRLENKRLFKELDKISSRKLTIKK